MNPLSLCAIVAGYKDKHVLSEVSLTLEQGTITGLLGRNGVGKTTLLRVALGLKRASAGDARLFGYGAWDAPPTVRKRIGFVAQEVRSFDWMTVSQCLKVVAGFYDSWDSDLVSRMCEQWRLSDRRIGKLSPGQRQCVAILLAVGHRPDLLVLDEPMASLDPTVRRDFLKLIGELNADNGQTVVLSSHICSDIERICSNVVILHDGRVVLDESVDDLKERVRRVVGLRSNFAKEHVIAQADDRVWLKNWCQYDLSRAARVDEVLLEDLFLDITA